MDLLWEFCEYFANGLQDLVYTDIVEHEINLKPGSKLFYTSGVWRFTPEELKVIQENLQEELATRKIIEYDGLWCTPIVLVKKKDGGYRKCIVYNGLNYRTERESWPLPNVEELLERIAGHKWYSACDGFSGYYAVKMCEEDILKMMFRTPFGTFAYVVMPFELKNALYTYSQLTYKTYAHLIEKTLEAYINDSATYSNSFEDHLDHLHKILEAALKVGI